MKKILFSPQCAWFVSNHLSSLVNILKKEGYEVIVATRADGTEDRLDTRFIALPVPVNPITPLADLRLLWHYYRLYRRVRPDIVHHFTIRPVIYGSIAARMARVPRIVNTVTGLGFVFSDRAKPWLRSVVKLQYRIALACAHFTGFENNEDRMLLINSGLVRSEKTGLLPMGVDIDQFEPVPNDNYSNKKDAVVFLMTARLVIDKGIYEFAEAASLVKKSFPEARFQLLGKRDEHNPYTVPLTDLQKWQETGVLEYLGEVSDVREILAKADVMVLPSYYREGAPRALLEAAAMAKPIITTDNVGCREVVQQGLNGILVPVKDASALADAMICLLIDSDRRNEMGLAGRDKIVREFDTSISIQRCKAAYRVAKQWEPETIAEPAREA